MNAYSSIIAIDFDTNDQVIEYMGKLSIYDYPDVVKRVCEELGDNIFIIIEKNTIGETIVESIKRDEKLEPKMYYTIEKNDKGLITKRFAGFQTTGRTKPLLMEAVKEFFKENLDKIYGERTILQLTTVDVVNGKLIGLPNDLIMCYAFIAYIKRNNLAYFDGHTLSNEKIFKSNIDNLSKEELLDYLYDTNTKIKDRITNSKITHGDPLAYLYDD